MKISQRAMSRASVLLILAVLVGLVLALIAWRWRHDNGVIVQPPPTATTLATTAPAPEDPAETDNKPGPTTSYIDVVRVRYPAFASTQPMGIPVDFAEAARIVLEQSVYVDPIGHLWLTDPKAPSVLALPRDPAQHAPHVVSERVVYVHWTANDSGDAVPVVFCADDAGHTYIPDKHGKTVLSRDYAMDRAFSWNDQVVVTDPDGVAIIQLKPKVEEIYHALPRPDGPKDAPAPGLAICVIPDGKGLLAWAPPSGKGDGKSSSRGASRFVDGAWADLNDSNGWPARITYLVPLLDGSVLQIGTDESNVATMTLSPLNAGKVDEAKVNELVKQMSNPDADTRLKAYQELTRFGPGIWPLLEKIESKQPPGARSRIRQLLKDKVTPTLGGMTLINGKMKPVAFLHDGGVVFYAEAGVSITRADESVDRTVPAWIGVQPGRAIALLAPALVRDLNPDKYSIEAINGEWIISDEVQGPRRFMGNHLAGLLRKNEREFGRVIGLDSRGRWLFRPADASDPRTLIIDPTLADPTPRLPVWEISAGVNTVGWDEAGWPVQKRGETAAWALHEGDWVALDLKKNRMFTRLEDMPAATTKPTTAPTQPTTAPTTGPSGEKPLLTDPDGNQYFDGKTTLTLVHPDGSTLTWPLPTEATGTGEAQLIRTADGRLFLFNEPGRVCRIQPTPKGKEPFALEATFTRGIPSSKDIQRIWLDPAGRIVIAWDSSKLNLLFPTGQIPRSIAQKMPRAEEPED